MSICDLPLETQNLDLFYILLLPNLWTDLRYEVCVDELQVFLRTPELLKHCRQHQAELPLPPSIVSAWLDFSETMSRVEGSRWRSGGRFNPSEALPCLLWLLHGEGRACEHVGLENLVRPHLPQRRKTYFCPKWCFESLYEPTWAV